MWWCTSIRPGTERASCAINFVAGKAAAALAAASDLRKALRESRDVIAAGFACVKLEAFLTRPRLGDFMCALHRKLLGGERLTLIAGAYEHLGPTHEHVSERNQSCAVASPLVLGKKHVAIGRYYSACLQPCQRLSAQQLSEPSGHAFCGGVIGKRKSGTF